jgi:hypothetical protein
MFYQFTRREIAPYVFVETLGALLKSLGTSNKTEAKRMAALVVTGLTTDSKPSRVAARLKAQCSPLNDNFRPPPVYLLSLLGGPAVA